MGVGEDPQIGVIESIQVGLAREYGDPTADDPLDRPWTTGFYKTSIAGPVWVGRLHLEGDQQADLENHGGVDKAVLAYAASHYGDWLGELDIPEIPPGAFGENLTVGTLTENDVSIGDIWRAGDVLLEVSQPRQPCWKLGRRWRMPRLPKRVVATGRSGWYLRVLEEGLLQPGDAIALVDRPHAEWTIARANRLLYDKPIDRDEAAQLAAVAKLSAAWRRDLLSRLGG